MRSFNICLLLVLLLPVNLVDCQLDRSGQFKDLVNGQVNDENVLVIKALRAIASGLEFFDLFKTSLNVDSLIGVRIFADQSVEIVEALQDMADQQGLLTNPDQRVHHNRLGMSLVNSLIDLNQQAEDLMRDSMASVEQDDPEYFEC